MHINLSQGHQPLDFMHLSLDSVSFTLVWRTSKEADEVTRKRVNTKVFILH